MVFGYRVDPITTLGFLRGHSHGCCSSGRLRLAPRVQSSLPIQGQGLALLKQEHNFMNAAVICAKLTTLCLLVYSGLIPLLCLH